MVYYLWIRDPGLEQHCTQCGDRRLVTDHFTWIFWSLGLAIVLVFCAASGASLFDLEGI